MDETSDNLRVLFQILSNRPDVLNLVNWDAFDERAREVGLERIGGPGPDGILVTKEQADLYRKGAGAKP